MSDAMGDAEIIGSFEFVGGPLGGEVRWGRVSGERRLPMFERGMIAGTAVYRATDRIRTNGNVEFEFVGIEPPTTDAS